MTSVPLSLYVHWPWCVRKCPYCDFNSHAAPASLDEAGYVEALLEDLEAWARADVDARERPIETIFIGGGTPSLMSPASVERLLSGIAARWRTASDVEVTLEANPGTADEAKFEGFARAGVNRLSLGVQSFSDERLARIGRIHDSAAALSAAGCAVRVFGNVNLDLMFALPGESLAALENDLELALSCGTTHLSFYQLTIEPGTAFAKRPPEDLPDEDLAADMGEAVLERLAAAGFEHYEVSGYAKPGRRCRHNLNYWTFGDYLGIGAGAHGKWTSARAEGLCVRREARHAAPARWLEAVKRGSGAAEVLEVPRASLPFEFMLNALRLHDGVPAGFFEARTGIARSEIEPTLSRLRAEGLLCNDSGRIAPTEKGLLFLSDLQEAFLEWDES